VGVRGREGIDLLDGIDQNHRPSVRLLVEDDGELVGDDDRERVLAVLVGGRMCRASVTTASTYSLGNDLAIRS
jgi:hypothetical protein